MRPLSDTLARLAAFRIFPIEETGNDHLVELTDFGSNPGALRAWTHIPEALRARSPLVVVLHGCRQTAGGYDLSAGWSQLAEERGFALLFPEQQRANNPRRCFNWFEPEDATRDSGEALSIREMIGRVMLDHRIDPRRVYITGLSAGGAMASTMLATYPELFAGGAIIAGLPHGVARTVPEAFDRMRGHGMPTPRALQALVRGASAHEGPWPVLSIWQGDADRTVAPSNAHAVLAQWRGLHGLRARPTRIEKEEGHAREVWCDAHGRPVIERFTIEGMGHGTPLLCTEEGGETAGPFMLDAGISSTRRIAEFWELAPPGAVRRGIEAALRKTGLI
ncbi:alpha/beta hydrolase family esterase [Roseococcus sp. YIM B11640]|uniref:extracellular catalytic domain type 1 short-chain-length polyhydroxyalkanoate depolymerase n=1 Tax=Roseococcus sp. YIM B11640 TaxID=3133973 RepID=UPI003C7C7ADB